MPPEDLEFELDEAATSARPPADLMSRLRAAPHWPEWQPEIMETEGPDLVDEGDVVRGRARMLGFGVYGHSTTLGVGAEHVEQDVLVGVRMRVRYEVEGDGHRTRIRHRLHLYPMSGPAGRILSVLLRWRLRRMQKTALRALAGQAGDPSL